MTDTPGAAARPVRVAHVTTIDLSLRYLLLNQLRSIQGDGYEVVGVSAPGPHVAALREAGIPHMAVPFNRRPFTPREDLQSFWALYRLFRRERFTIVHTHNPKPGFYGQLAAKLARVPVIVNTLHGFYFHEHTPPHQRRTYIAMEHLAARCSDVILSQNREDIDTAVRERICPPGKILQLGNGIDVSRFDRARLREEDQAQLRRKLGLPEGKRIVGFVGRLVEEKGLLELFAAIRILRDAVPDVHFLIIGPTDEDKPDALRPERAHEFGVAGACTFTGMRQDLPELMGLMDVFTLPSHREGFPRTPMEASAMGVPCVVTDIRGCREAVEQGVNGYLVPLRDSQVLAAAIKRILDEPETAAAMRAAGRRLALDRFDEQLVFEKVKREYRRLLPLRGIVPPGKSGSVPHQHKASGTGPSGVAASAPSAASVR